MCVWSFRCLAHFYCRRLCFWPKLPRTLVWEAEAEAVVIVVLLLPPRPRIPLATPAAPPRSLAMEILGILIDGKHLPSAHRPLQQSSNDVHCASLGLQGSWLSSISLLSLVGVIDGLDVVIACDGGGQLRLHSSNLCTPHCSKSYPGREHGPQRSTQSLTKMLHIEF